jgi:hypothetical protein
VILQSWRIASEHLTPRWWWVRVHSSAEDLRRAAYRYQPWTGKRFWANDALGCCQHARPLVHEDADPDVPAPDDLLWPSYGFAGVIRFAAEALYPEVVHHEVLHAACATYRMNVAMDLHLGTGFTDMSREEDLAYIHGQLAADMDDALKSWCG